MNLQGVAALPRTAPLPMRHRFLAAFSATALLVSPGSAAIQDQTEGARFPVSTALAEARLTLDGVGVIDDKQRPPLLARVFDWLYPF